MEYFWQGEFRQAGANVPRSSADSREIALRVVAAQDPAAGGVLASAVLAMSFSTVTHAATTISGTPATSVAANRYYGFQSWATDNTGRPVTYGIRNKPAWATFDTKYGHLYGVPTSASVGVYQNIIVYATDGLSTAYLSPFNITVTGTANSGQ